MYPPFFHHVLSRGSPFDVGAGAEAGGLLCAWHNAAMTFILRGTSAFLCSQDSDPYVRKTAALGVLVGAVPGAPPPAGVGWRVSGTLPANEAPPPLGFQEVSLYIMSIMSVGEGAAHLAFSLDPPPPPWGGQDTVLVPKDGFAECLPTVCVYPGVRPSPPSTAPGPEAVQRAAQDVPGPWPPGTPERCGGHGGEGGWRRGGHPTFPS